MKFIAVRSLADQATRTAGRFPFTLLAAAAATTAAIRLIESSGSHSRGIFLMAAILGLPLLTALELLVLRLGNAPIWRAAVPVVGLAILGAFYSLAGPGSDVLNWTRFFQWALVFHLLASVVPVLAGAGSRAFWQFNRHLFERFLLASFYTLILFLGLGLALLAIDRLFGVTVDGDRYPQLFAVLALLFHPWFFLTGVPHDWTQLERSTDYPIGLKIFAQYILVPLVTVYLTILIAYFVRVVVTRAWPSGWIGYLVSGVSGAGTLALLLVQPIRERPEERWVNGYARWFFLGLLPALVMALLAVGKRIGQYGVTERRYALLVLALWLLAVAIFYTVSRSRSIRLIPASLALVALVTMFGPWGMFATAKRSQGNRFREVAARVLAAGNDPSPDDRQELTAIIGYLDEVHGRAGIAAALRLAPGPLIAAPTRDSVGSLVFTAAGLPAPSPEDQGPAVRYFAASVGAEAVPEGWDLGDGARVYGNQSALSAFRIRFGTDTIVFTPHRAAGELAVTRRDTLLMLLNVYDALAPALQESGRPDGRPVKPVLLVGSTPGLTIRFLLQTGQWTPADSNARSADGILLVSAR